MRKSSSSRRHSTLADTIARNVKLDWSLQVHEMRSDQSSLMEKKEDRRAAQPALGQQQGKLEEASQKQCIMQVGACSKNCRQVMQKRYAMHRDMQRGSEEPIGE